MTDRGDELAANLAEVERRLDAACATAGRAREDVTLVVVTKHFPADDVRLLAALGVRHVGENRHQEAVVKHEACADVTSLTWHYVGHLQSNKAAAVAGWADVVQSVDRTRLVAPLGRAASDRGRPLAVLLQVSLDPEAGEGGRSGAAPGDVPGLADAVASTEGLELRGLMAVAPRGDDPRPAFARLAEVAADLRSGHPTATWVSAGMSGDLEAAEEHGATHVRVGTAVLGMRPLRG